MESQTRIEGNVGSSTLASFYASIYGWMTVGMLISALTAYVTLNTNLGANIFANPAYFYGLFALQIGLMLGIQFLINKLPAEISRGLFFIYTAITGIFLSGLALMYSGSTLTTTFLVTAALYGGLAIYGFTTQKDLSSWGTAIFVGIIGVFSVSLINMIIGSSVLHMILSAVALMVFSAATVYDNQMYKAIYAQNANDNNSLKKMATLGALHMYINFIVMFQSLLSLFGGRD